MTIRNHVQLIGNVGNDPEITTFESGNKNAKISIATNETYKDQQGNKQTNTQWHNCTAWGKTVDIIEKYITKGKEIAVQGKLQTRSYEADGQKRYVTEIVINEILLLGSK